MKTCARCQATKSLTAFYLDNRSKCGRASWCKVCVGVDHKARRARDPEGEKRRRQKWHQARLARGSAGNRKYLYGMKPGEYQQILQAQGGVCKICLKPETTILKGHVMQLAVDHDHRLNVIRGLLCTRCNRALGGFKDDSDLLLRASNYLQGVA